MIDAGALSPQATFYFPRGTFNELGRTTVPDTFLWVVDHLETAFIGAYLAAIRRFGELGRTDLALLTMRILGVECEHRVLYRIISENAPANNVTLEVNSFTCVGQAITLLQPFVTGRGFPNGATGPITLPTAKQIALVVGRNSSS